MNYSFVSPNKKTLLKKVSRIWWGYIFLTLFIFVGFVVTLKIQGYFMEIKTAEALQAQQTALDEIKKFQEIRDQEAQRVQF